MPSFTEIMLPMLELSKDQQDVDTFEVEKILAEKFKLTKRERTISKNTSKERLFLNKIRWAKTHLSMAGLIKYTLKNWFVITKRGIEFLKSNPIRITEKTLLEFKEYAKLRFKIIFDYEWCMPNKWTFTIKPIREFLEREIKGKVVDPCSGQSEFGDIRNDINPNSKAHCNLEAEEFLKRIRPAYADTVLLDLPYSPRQVSESYKAIGIKATQQHTQSSFYCKIKDQVSRILKEGGIVISFGWNANGMG